MSASNAVRYSASRFFSFLSGLLPSLVSLFLPRKENLAVFNSFHNRAFSDNTKFLFLYFIKCEREFTARYVVNDDDLRQELNSEIGEYFIETKTLRGKIFALSAGFWFVNAFELPVQGIALRFRRRVIHLTHGVTAKNAGLFEKDISFLKRFYYAILRTDISFTITPFAGFRKDVAGHLGVKESRCIVAPFPRFDPLVRSEFQPVGKDCGEFAILYAPTWRHWADVRLFPFPDFDAAALDEFCKGRGVKIYIRVHPRFENSIPEEICGMSCVRIFGSAECSDVNESLAAFDALITDYSSIFWDFMILNRPLFFFLYDFEEYERRIGLIENFGRYAAGYRPKSQSEFFKAILDAVGQDSFRAEREKIRREVLGVHRDNCAEFMDVLRKTGVMER